MNGLFLVIISALIFVLAYRFYGAFIAAKVLTVNQYKVTPAFRFEDGHDYVPTNKYVVFGHHFAAIAGAGPLVGPVIAAQFGYLPGACGSSSAVFSPVPSTTWSSSLHPCAMTANPSPKSPKLKLVTKSAWQHLLPSCSSTSWLWPAWPSSSSTPFTTALGVLSRSA